MIFYVITVCPNGCLGLMPLEDDNAVIDTEKCEMRCLFCDTLIMSWGEGHGGRPA